MELEDHKGRLMISRKQLIVVDSRILGFVVWSSLGAICKKEGIGCISS